MSELALYGRGLFGDPIDPPKRGKMADTFLVPPFTVLNAREGFWQERKAAWIRKGIKSEVSRFETLRISEQARRYKGGYEADSGNLKDASGTSVFDPVLCELCYRWFCPNGGTILDPFAGGSVRGIVASCLGRKYTGVELRPEQIASNRDQAALICDVGPVPEWIEGDSAEIRTLAAHVKADFLFSCPPYGDLERYSDDPRDLSTLPYQQFRERYAAIIREACTLLNPDSFACFVVGDIRDKRGHYCNFVSDTIGAFRDAGLAYYNEAILITAVGSLPIRVTKQFNASRKLGKTHQNVLVFVKGDGKRAASKCENTTEPTPAAGR